MDKMMQYCPCRDEAPDPCPLCGATVAGNDSVNGVCQCPPLTDYGTKSIMLSAIREWIDRVRRSR